jgi:hypothetical protein
VALPGRNERIKLPVKTRTFSEVVTTTTTHRKTYVQWTGSNQTEVDDLVNQVDPTLAGYATLVDGTAYVRHVPGTPSAEVLRVELGQWVVMSNDAPGNTGVTDEVPDA